MKYFTRRELTPVERDQYGMMPDLVAHLLYHRGIVDSESAQRFISPDYDRDTHNPFLLKDAEKSAERIIRAIKNNEKIAVYADYDADGIPGAALFDDFLRRIGFSNYIVYIPHRHNEGFGLNVDAIEQLADQGVKLIITIDCGISDFMPVQYANEKGLEVIITDHHEPPSELPKAFAIVDHKQVDCNYPDKNLCGSGVAYKLIQAILVKERFGLREGHEKWLLDLVGMATLSDMVPLVGENRVFAHYGLTVIRKTQRKGLVRLLSMLRINQRYLSEDDIAFMITPRINAASRMGVPTDAFKLLSADNDADAEYYAKHLDEINNERKGIVASLVKEVKKTVRDRHSGSIPSVIVLGNPTWRPALLGLAANSCAEEFNCPVFLWGRDGDNLIKGSCRSEGQTHVVDLMRAVPSGILAQFGGHKFSGGFSVVNESVHFLEKHLNDAFEKISNGQSVADTADFIDAELGIDQITADLYDEISKLAPFGTGNPKPIFIFRNVVPVKVRKFGKGNDHLEFGFKRKDGSMLSAIAFFGANNEKFTNIKEGQSLDLIASIEQSMFRGRAEIRLRVVDVC